VDLAIEFLKLLTPVLLLIITVLLAVIGYFGRQKIGDFTTAVAELKTELKEGIRENEDKIVSLEKDFYKHQARLPHLFITKDEHVRHMTIVEKKIDELRHSTEQNMGLLNSDIKLLLHEMSKRPSNDEA